MQRHMNSGREMFEDPLEEVAVMLSLAGAATSSKCDECH